VSTSLESMLNDDERRFALLGVLLQVLHILFGVTAVIGMYLNHHRLPKMQSILWRNHCRWQLTTFWFGAALYAITILIGLRFSIWWPFIVSAMWVTYRILVSAVGVASKEPPQRLFSPLEKL